MAITFIQLMLFYLGLIVVASVVGSLVSGGTGMLIGLGLGVTLSAVLYVTVGQRMVAQRASYY